MPQEASKISDPDTTAAPAEEVVAESSNKNATHESEDESGEEATETVEGGEGATEKKKSRKRKIKDALSGKGKAPEVTDLNAPAALQAIDQWAATAPEGDGEGEALLVDGLDALLGLRLK